MINDIVSEHLQVKPLAEGETVTFRRVKADTLDRQRDNQPTKVSDYSMAGEEMIVDPFDKKTPRKRIMNITGYNRVKMPDETFKDVPIIGNIKWRGSEITVTSADYDLYCFLTRSNKNIDNPFRDKRVSPLFYKKDIKKKLREQDASVQRRLNAMNWVNDAKPDEIKAIAKNLQGSKHNVNLDSAPEYIKTNLMGIADRDPDAIILASTNKLEKRKIHIEEAEKYDLILWNPEAREWFFKDNKSPICQVDVGTDRITGLITYLFEDKDGKADNAKLTKLLKDLHEVYA